MPYPPFEDFDKNAESGFKGFDVDLVSKFAEGLDLKLAIKDSDFNTLQIGVLLNSRRCDLGASAMTINRRAEEEPALQRRLLRLQAVAAGAHRSDIASIDDLAGKTVTVQRGTTGEAYTKETRPTPRPISTPTAARCTSR